MESDSSTDERYMGSSTDVSKRIVDPLLGRVVGVDSSLSDGKYSGGGPFDGVCGRGITPANS